MDLSSWETLGAGGASALMSKVQRMTESFTGKNETQTTSSGQAMSAAKAIPFSNESGQNEELWLLGRKYWSQTGKRYMILD